MKKLVLATAVALFGADATFASQFVTPWFQGDFSCRIAGSNDMLTLSFRTSSQRNTQCNGDKCTTSGYSMIVSPKARLSSWGGATNGTNVYHKGNYIHFYVPVAGDQAMVQLQKSYRHFLHRVVYTGKYVSKGKTWQLTCTR